MPRSRPYSPVDTTPRAAAIAINAVLVCGAVVMVGPFVWQFLTSFKSLAEATRVPPYILPPHWNFSAYSRVFQSMPFVRMFTNTVIITVVRVPLQVLFCSMAAYAFARLRFPGRDVVFAVFLATMMVPSQFLIIPQYQIIQSLGQLNTLTALIIPNFFSVFGTFLLRQFFLALPRELDEAAKIDGAGPVRTYWLILMPLARPSLIAFGILCTVWSWNDLLWPLVVNSDPTKMPLPVGLANLQGKYLTDYPVLMAGSFMAAIPLIALFVAFQRQFIYGIALSGLKG